ncbi:hypothetical protein [Streptococcus oralis]|uniref:hypothetical protein n=1 Tax=Streptococcus oralis TaxID=1303 RepID=UPI00077D868D|nr:hypothetical protein [Streptococcus oralis]
MLERLMQLLVLLPYFYFFYWIEKANKDSKYFALFYYFYWIYLPLWALFSIAFAIFSILTLNIVLENPSDIGIWGIWLLLIFLSLVNGGKTYNGLKNMLKLRNIRMSSRHD